MMVNYRYICGVSGKTGIAEEGYDVLKQLYLIEKLQGKVPVLRARENVKERGKPTETAKNREFRQCFKTVQWR
jgi:hypothetical protein